MILLGDCRDVLKTIESDSIDCCVTSPPYYGLRDYNSPDQIGMETDPKKYIENMVSVFLEVYRVLKPEGTLWLNMGDSYSGSGRGVGTKEFSSKQSTNKGANILSKSVENGLGMDGRKNIPVGYKRKDLLGIPWRVAIALQDSGWYLRQDIIWSKPNPMPESVRDRCTKAHEYIFLFSKTPNYYFDWEAIKEPAVNGPLNTDKPRPSKKKGEFVAKGEPMPGRLPFRAVTEYRNKRSVWTVAPSGFKGAHFATYPEELILPCVLAGSPEGGIVLDPFSGSGTTAAVAKKNKRKYLAIDSNKDYVGIAEERLRKIDEDAL